MWAPICDLGKEKEIKSMKIKRKVQKNLPQLIEYIFANNLKHKWKDSDNKGGYIHVYDDGKISVDKCTVDSTFTVEVEEEITEDTEFKSIIEVTTDDLFAVWEHASISAWESEHSKEFHAYIDGEFKLIWRDGKLVE